MPPLKHCIYVHGLCLQFDSIPIFLPYTLSVQNIFHCIINIRRIATDMLLFSNSGDGYTRGMISDISPIGLRVPDDLKKLIRSAAKKNGRSMNTEMATRLQESFDPRMDLSRISTGDLIRELINRNQPGRICIEINQQKSND